MQQGEGGGFLQVDKILMALLPFEGGCAKGLVGGYASRAQALLLLLYLWVCTMPPVYSDEGGCERLGTRDVKRCEV